MDIEDQIKKLKESGVSRTKAALALGVSKDKLDDMLEVLELDWKPRIRGGTYVIDGVTDTLHSHAKALGVPPTTLRQRLIKGHDPVKPALVTQITGEDAQRFAQLRKEGVTASKAAEIVGKPEDNLRNAARKLIPDYATIAPASDPIVREEAERFAQLRKNGMSGVKAAELLGRPRHNLRRAARKFIADYEETPSSILPISPEEAERYVQLRKAGMSSEKAAESVGRARKSLGEAVRKFFPDCEEPPSLVIPVSRDEAERFLQLRNTGMTTVKAAELMGRSRRSLGDAARKFFPDCQEAVERPSAHRCAQDTEYSSNAA
jgi:lambda repressor-like predicted transcriptional regulator